MCKQENMEKRRNLLSERLESLGYRQALSLESVPLVDRLLADLIQTTESLQKYINVAKKAVQVITLVIKPSNETPK